MVSGGARHAVSLALPLVSGCYWHIHVRAVPYALLYSRMVHCMATVHPLSLYTAVELCIDTRGEITMPCRMAKSSVLDYVASGSSRFPACQPCSAAVL